MYYEVMGWNSSLKGGRNGWVMKIEIILGM
jgi:hypothetical protein